MKTRTHRLLFTALLLVLTCLAGCRVTRVTNERGSDPLLRNSGAPAPYVRGSVRDDGTHVRPYTRDK